MIILLHPARLSNNPNYRRLTGRSARWTRGVDDPDDLIITSEQRR